MSYSDSSDGAFVITSQDLRPNINYTKAYNLRSGSLNNISINANKVEEEH